MRKTNSFGGFEKLFENKLLENNSNHPHKYSLGNNKNTAPTSNRVLNGGAITSNFSTSINTNVFNTVTNTSPSARVLITNSEDTSQGVHSSRINYEIARNNVSRRTICSNKILDIENLLTQNSVSEKEEESSNNATQETIEKRPTNFMNSSNSQNISNQGNITSISVETKIYNQSNEKIISDTIEMISDRSNTKKLSQLTKNNQMISDKNDLRKSVAPLYSTNSYKTFLDKSSHNPICVLKSHFDSVRNVYLSPDQQTLVSVGEDMLINYWDFQKSFIPSKENLEPYFTIRTHTTPIFNMTGPKFKNSSNDSYTVYSSGIDGVIRCNRIFSADYDRSLSSEEIHAKATLHPWRAHQDMIWHLDCHPSLSILSSLSSDGTVKIFKTYEETNSDKFYYSNKSRSKSLVKQLTFKNLNHNFIEIPTHSDWSTKTINHLYVSYVTPFIKLFDVETGKSVTDFTFNTDKNVPFENQQTNKLIYDDSNNLLITGHEDRHIKFFDANHNKMIKSITAHTDGVSALTTSGREYEFISGSHDGSIRCWDIRIFKLLFDIPAHRKKYDDGCLSILSVKENNLIITSGADGLIKIFKFY